MAKVRDKKRAIALAGGGPAAGFHIGALKAFEEHDIEFDVWSLSCIGAWVGIYYNQLPGTKGRADKTRDFFRDHGFRDTESYKGFPVNKAFAPNLHAVGAAWWKHLTDPRTFFGAVAPEQEWKDAWKGWQQFLQTPGMWTSKGDLNVHVLNNILAVHPMSRLLTSLIYLSGTNGLSNIYYDDSSFLGHINLDNLRRDSAKEIYHNAWRFDPDGGAGKLQLFNNKHKAHRDGGRRRDYDDITHASLCACSALPYIEQTVHIPNGTINHEYSEGALVDTVSFMNLVEDHPDLDEIWVCRIVDYRQIRAPKNLHDSLANLCQQFAAEVGENDIRIFRNHLRKSAGRIPRIVEIPVTMAAEPKKDGRGDKAIDKAEAAEITFRWDHANLHNGVGKGHAAVQRVLEDKTLREPTTEAKAWPEHARHEPWRRVVWRTA